jgi:nitrite reductase (NADH) large subunit
MTQKLVIIGNGMAPGRMLEHLFEQAPGLQVTVFNAEPRVNYDRIMLSPVLSGEKSYEDIVIHGDGWYIKHGITLYKGHKIVAIDRAAKTVTSDHGVTESAYDKLIVATGSVPDHHSGAGQGSAGRHHLSRSRRRASHAARGQVARKGRRHRRRSARAGGGGRAASRGMDVTVLHVMPTLMERQLDRPPAISCRRLARNAASRSICKANTQAIVGEKQGRGHRAR